LAVGDESRELNQIYGAEKKSVAYQWHRRMQTRFGNALALWMARHWQRLPERWSQRLGFGVGNAMRVLSPRHVGIVRTNLTLAFGDTRTSEEIEIMTKACYLHLGSCMAEFMRLPNMTDEELCELAELRGKEHIDAALADGKGVILLTGHLGNWEIAGSRIAAEGYPLSVIARAQRDTAITDHVRRTRETLGMRVLHRDVAVRQSMRALRHNELVGILLDQNAGDDGIFVDFFGHLASTAPGAAAFALRTEAAVLPTFDWRRADHTHVVEVSAPVPLIRSGDRNKDLRINTSRYTKIIEQQIRAHPEQWLWLHKRWKARPLDERTTTE